MRRVTNSTSKEWAKQAAGQSAILRAISIHMTLRVKICCMGSVNEAATAIRLGATAIGLVSRMPSGPGPIEESLITEIISTVPPAIETFLLTSETSAASISAQQRRTG